MQTSAYCIDSGWGSCTYTDKEGSREGILVANLDEVAGEALGDLNRLGGSGAEWVSQCRRTWKRLGQEIVFPLPSPRRNSRLQGVRPKPVRLAQVQGLLPLRVEAVQEGSDTAELQKIVLLETASKLNGVVRVILLQASAKGNVVLLGMSEQLQHETRTSSISRAL